MFQAGGRSETRPGDHAPRLSAILCADWGKEFPKRSVYVADVSARVVRRVAAKGWSVAGVLDEAERWTSTGAVLATFDVPLGVPESFLAALSRVSSRQSPLTFLDLLARTRSMPRFSVAVPKLVVGDVVKQTFQEIRRGSSLRD